MSHVYPDLSASIIVLNMPRLTNRLDQSPDVSGRSTESTGVRPAILAIL